MTPHEAHKGFRFKRVIKSVMGHSLWIVIIISGIMIRWSLRFTRSDILSESFHLVLLIFFTYFLYSYICLSRRIWWWIMAGWQVGENDYLIVDRSIMIINWNTVIFFGHIISQSSPVCQVYPPPRKKITCKRNIRNFFIPSFCSLGRQGEKTPQLIRNQLCKIRKIRASGHEQVHGR